MAVQEYSRVAPFGALSIFRIVNLFEGAVSAYSNWRAERATVTTLNALTTRELNDIGLTRADIARVARAGR